MSDLPRPKISITLPSPPALLVLRFLASLVVGLGWHLGARLL